MKKSLFIAAFVTVVGWNAGNVLAQNLPQSSPAATVEQTVGLTDVKITYSRPGVKDRKIFGELVPYGELWRTGANKATAISFSTDVKIQGNALKAGTYAIFTIPGEDEWTFIFNNNTEQWGAEGHKDEEDVLKIKVKSQVTDFKESMLFYIDHLRDQSATINLAWDKVLISVPMEVSVDEEAMKNIKMMLEEANGMFRVYNNAAKYYLDHGKDVKSALDWAGKSVSMDKKFWNLTVLAQAQAANGMSKEAIKTAEEALAMAQTAKNAHYTKVNQDNIAAWKAKK